MQDTLQNSEVLLSIMGLVLLEVLSVVILMTVTVSILKLIYNKVEARAKSEKIRNALQRSWRSIKLFSIIITTAFILLILASNGWLVKQGENPIDFTLSWLLNIPMEAWLDLLISSGKILLATILIKYIVSGLKSLLIISEKKLKKFSQLNQDGSQLPKFFSSLSSVLSNALWMLLAVFIVRQLLIPEFIQELLLKLITIYLIIGIGLIAVRMVAMAVATLEALSAHYIKKTSWADYHEALQPLMPLLSRSLEYVIWIATATLVLAQVSAFAKFALYGPRLMQSIGIFFLARVVIEAGYLLIEGRKNDDDGDDIALRRRATITPLLKTVFRTVTYFIALVMILGALGIDIMPFLAGAGILGVVIGFGAQPLINDIVSGFFILFENIFLVGDTIHTGSVLGKVEHIDFRTTKLRDPDGNLHILRNGEINNVKNYNKDYTFAVVEVRVGYKENINDVKALLADCGETIRKSLPEYVTGDLVIAGIVEFEASAMRIRTTIPVTPAKHFLVATQLREIIKQAFDEKGWNMPAPHQVISFQNQTEVD